MARSHNAMSTAIFLIITNELHRIQCKCTYSAIPRTYPASIQFVGRKNKSQLQIAFCEWAFNAQNFRSCVKALVIAIIFTACVRSIITVWGKVMFILRNICLSMWGEGVPCHHPRILPLPLVPCPFWGVPILHLIIVPLVPGPFLGGVPPSSSDGGTPCCDWMRVPLLGLHEGTAPPPLGLDGGTHPPPLPSETG